MSVLLIIIHVMVCVGLIGLVLIQRGRGSGLVESFSGVESMFGTKTNEFLTRTTTILSVIFFITCLSLAVLSVRQSRSLLRDVVPRAPMAQNVTTAQVPPIQTTAALPQPAAGPEKPKEATK